MSDIVNYNGAIQYTNHVLHYLMEEVEYDAISSPFVDPPINNIHLSPFMTRDKSRSLLTLADP